MLRWMKQSRRGRRGSTREGALSPFHEAVLVILFWAPWHSRLALGDAGHLRGRGQCSELSTAQGEDRPLVWCPWRHHGHALCACLVCRACQLTGGPRRQTSTFSLSMFAGWILCGVFASILTGGADVPLSMREGHVRVDRCRFRVVIKGMSPSTCDGKAVDCLGCWVDSGFDVANAVFRECGEKRDTQARARGGPSAVAEGYGPPSSVVSPSALGA